MLEFILEEHERTGKPLPEKIKNAPKLNSGLEFYMSVFALLATCRNMNGYIPFIDIESFCRMYDIRGVQKEDLHNHIRVMDIAYNKFQEKKRPRG